MAFRFEFDPVNKILVGRMEGLLSDESIREIYQAGRKYSVATDASAAILDFSLVTGFPLTSERLRQLAREEPAMPNAERPRFVVAPQTHAFGLFRMFQLTGESTRPLLTVVHTMDEALAALGVQSPRFEPLA
jgi:hypothetical protein